MTLLNSYWNVIWHTLLEHPWWLLCLFYPLVYIWRLNANEKSRWGDRLHLPTPYLIKTLFLGTFVGTALSLLFSFYSVYFSFTNLDILFVWCSIVFLSLFRWRFICISYAIALCGLLQLVLPYLPHTLKAHPWLVACWETVTDFPLYDWLWLVALLHLCESFLIRVDGNSGKQIIERIDVDGQKINGFYFMQIWPIPLLLPTAVGLFPFPIMVSFADHNFSRPILQRQRRGGTLIFLYAFVLVLLLLISTLYPSFLFGAWLFSWLGHEGIYQWNRIRDRKASPCYISTNKGLYILDVLPYSPAAEMGIKTGDILHRVNGKEIQSIEEVINITSQVAYCKLEVLDEQLDQHLLHRPIYEDDPYHLGMVVAHPQTNAPAMSEEGKENEQII